MGVAEKGGATHRLGYPHSVSVDPNRETHRRSMHAGLKVFAHTNLVDFATLVASWRRLARSRLPSFIFVALSHLTSLALSFTALVFLGHRAGLSAWAATVASPFLIAIGLIFRAVVQLDLQHGVRESELDSHSVTTVPSPARIDESSESPDERLPLRELDDRCRWISEATKSLPPSPLVLDAMNACKLVHDLRGLPVADVRSATQHVEVTVRKVVRRIKLAKLLLRLRLPLSADVATIFAAERFSRRMDSRLDSVRRNLLDTSDVNGDS